MSKWLQKLTAPVAAIWLCVFAAVFASVLSPNGNYQEAGEVFAGLAFPLVLTGWLLADARKRGRRLCYDYDSFVFVAWPVLLPFYLFQTRGWRAFITLLYFAGICTLAWVFGFVVELLRD